jgi:cellulose synthase/poly-beta-1,6-N-acetylglucosamine synthase-like glycosyltransferase
MFELAFLIFVSVYFLQVVIFLIGLKKKFIRLSDDKLPSSSIIVAAKNEEENILRCLESLAALEYPQNKLEIIIVNDHSSDRTQEIIDGFISGKNIFKCIVPEKEIGHLKGKANAIANGILYSKNEIIMTTDADCAVSKTWAKTIASYYQKDVAIVNGFTNQLEGNSFEAMQSKDFLYLLGVASGTINLGKPLSCIGNNMSYRRSVYEEIGGYEKIPFSVTEDFKLLMAVHALKKYKIIYPLDKNALVTSIPCKDLKALYLQKKRWGIGGLDSDIIGFGVMAFGFAVHIGMLLLPFFISQAAFSIALFKVIVDYFFLRIIHKELNLKLKFLHFLSFEIYFVIYVILLPFIVLLNPNVKWKGREFKRKS